MQLYLCEKPSQAKDIAAVLGAKRRGDGCWLGTVSYTHLTLPTIYSV